MKVITVIDNIVCINVEHEGKKYQRWNSVGVWWYSFEGEYGEYREYKDFKQVSDDEAVELEIQFQKIQIIGKYKEKEK